MADTKISALTSGNPAQSGDEIPIARSGANYKITAGSIASLSSTPPGGSNTQVQFNNSGAFGGSANLTWDGTNVQIGATGALRLADTDSSNYVAFKSPGTVASNVTWTLPSADGTSNQVLTTNGSGTLSWSTPSGSGDVVGPASAVDSQIALFNSTTGKLIKAATTTGLLKASSGVIAAAVSSTDYAPATTGTNAQLLANSGSGGFANVTVGSNLALSAGTLTAGLVWQSVQTTGFTAVAGRAYPCNTTSAAFTVTLPSSPSAGDQITLTDYAGTWDTNNLTINPNGGKINGDTNNGTVSTERGAVNLVYVDSTQGWISYASNLSTVIYGATPTIDYLIVAGGGGGGSGNGGAGGGGGAGGFRTGTGLTVTSGVTYTISVGGGGNGAYSGGASGNGGSGVVIIRYPDTYFANIGTGLTGQTSGTIDGFRYTRFTSGTGSFALVQGTLPLTVEYLVVAGGGAGSDTGGGGAGGLLYGVSSTFQTGLTYNITVGGGGTGGTNNTASRGTNGSNSSITGTSISFTAIGGGGGGAGFANSTISNGADGGSGGGGSTYSGSGIQRVGGSGTPGQGFGGGTALANDWVAGGGGGAGGAGGSASGPATSGAAGVGGPGLNYSVQFGTHLGVAGLFAGGGGGGTGGGASGGTGGSGGGGNGEIYSSRSPAAGTSNTGGGGGGSWEAASAGNGGSGTVVIKIPTIYTATFSVGLTTAANTTVVPGFRIYSVTAGTGTVTFSLV